MENGDYRLIKLEIFGIRSLQDEGVVLREGNTVSLRSDQGDFRQYSFDSLRQEENRLSVTQAVDPGRMIQSLLLTWAGFTVGHQLLVMFDFVFHDAPLTRNGVGSWPRQILPKL